MLERTDKYTVYVVGSAETGKTSLIKRLDKKEFTDEYTPTTGVVPYVINQLHFYDLSGQRKFEKIILAFLSNANAFIFCFDLSNLLSFQEIQHWMEKIERKDQTTYNLALKILIGNKSDLKNERISSQAKNYAEQKQITYIEVSAKKSTDVKLNKIFKGMPNKKQLNLDDCEWSSSSMSRDEKTNDHSHRHPFFKAIVLGASTGFIVGVVAGGVLGLLGVPWTGGLSLITSPFIIGAAMAILGAVIVFCMYTNRE